MTVQAYINNIRAKTGRSLRDFERLARARGLLRPEVTVGEVIAWLKEEFDLGYGRSLVVYSLLKPKMGKKTRRKVAPNK